MPGFWREYENDTDLGKVFTADIFRIVYKESYFYENIVDYKRKVDDKADLLLMEVSCDAEYLISVSKSMGHQLIVETNGIKYFDFGGAFNNLCKRNLFDEQGEDARGKLFILNSLGKNIAEDLKFV